MERDQLPDPTEREMQILQVLWDRGEASVREVYETLRDDLGIVQNTVQTFLRTMTEKGLVAFRKSRRSFIYRATVRPAATKQRLLDTVLQRTFDGALDQLVETAVSLRKPSPDELARLRGLLDEVESNSREDLK